MTEARKEQISAIIKNTSLDKSQIPVEEVRRAMAVLEAERVDKFDKQLMEYGCTDPEMRKVCSRWMCFMENSPFDIIDAKGERIADHMKNYVSFQQILDYSVTGKGLNAAYDNKVTSKN